MKIHIILTLLAALILSVKMTKDSLDEADSIRFLIGSVISFGFLVSMLGAYNLLF